VQALLESTVLLGASVTLALAAMVLVRRSTRLATLEAHKEIAGFVYATIGVIYAVLLAFVCIVAWERYADASHAAEQEATTVTSLYELARGLTGPGHQQIQAALAAYALEVSDVEWKLMASGRQSPRAAQDLSELWQSYAQLSESDRQQAGYSESLHLMSLLQEERGQRLAYADEVVPRVVWVVLIAGGIITIAFTYLFGVKSALAQSLMTSAITVTVAGVLVLTFILDDPFRGDVRVTPESMEATQQLIAAESGLMPLDSAAFGHLIGGLP
jgi:hypothetical protein